MLENLKNLAGLPGMMSKMGEMKARMAEMQEKVEQELTKLRAEADAGGGLVTATCNGKMELVGIKFAADRLGGDSDDVELLEDLVVAAVAAAQAKAREQAADVTKREMQKVAESLDLPPGLMDQLKGGGLG